MRIYSIVSSAKTYALGICLLQLIGLASCKPEKKYAKVSKETQIQAMYNDNLQKAFEYLDSLNLAKEIKTKQDFFKKSRSEFKLSEPILSYAEKENYASLNSPNLLRIYEEDATDIKINNPIGYQVIEEVLFDENVDTIALKEVVLKTSQRLKLLDKNSKIHVKDYHIIWMLRNAITRVATTGLSNFDSPMLGQSLKESALTYKTILKIINIYKGDFQDKKVLDVFTKSVKKSINTLENANFDTFDRYEFIKTQTHEQLEGLVAIQNDWKVKFPFEMALKNDVTSLFSTSTFNNVYFSDHQSDNTYLKDKIALGKELFNDKMLSKDNTMSCATCHVKELAFTDGKRTFNEHQKRNTPTLTYATFQKAFFYDKRVGGLEGQIVGVVNNNHEFNSDLKEVTKKVKSNKKYVKAFDTLYTKKVTDANIRHAIASYIRTLNTFDSKFDRNINKEEKTLASNEIKGFNLFMGKASCATCHFPPTFNGTIPPDFRETELEVLGVPKTKKWENAIVDNDLGRHDVFQTEERKHAFKTPTIRNIEKTAPYMHNGVYDNLEEVMRFYNLGGGAGIGIHLDNQTLPFDNLNLTDEEIADIVAFMKTLTDK